MRRYTLDIGLVFLRLALGVVFVAHGWQKVFGFGLSGLTAFFESIGIPFAGLNAVIVMIVELGGGAALLAGGGTRLVATLLATTMAVAIATVHGVNGFWIGDNGYEFTLVLLLANLALLLTGAGRFSVDHALARRRAPRVAAGLSSPVRRAA